MPHKTKAARKAWYRESADQINARRRERYAAMPELREKNHGEQRRYREENPEKVKGANAKWRAENREDHLARRRIQYHATKVLKRKPKTPADEMRQRRNDRKKKKRRQERINSGKAVNGRKLPDIACENCGKVIRPKLKRQRFCSRKCSTRKAVLVVVQLCEHCNTPFKPNKRGMLYCSQRCYRGHACATPTSLPTGEPKPCAFCGALFTPTPKRTKFCSDVCGQRSRSTIRTLAITGEMAMTSEEWVEVKEYFGQRCAYCHKPSHPLSQDHIEPLSRNGQHVRDNVVPACISCNCSKNDRNIIEWLACKKSQVRAITR